jgi:hypothetical protein
MKADDPRRYPTYDDATLKRVIDELNGRIVQLQKAKQRAKLPQMQSELHAMRMEYKRREGAVKRAKYNGQHTTNPNEAG